MSNFCSLGARGVAPGKKKYRSVTDGKYPEPTETLPITEEDVKDIKPRPNVQNTEVDENGNFIRQQN